MHKEGPAVNKVLTEAGRGIWPLREKLDAAQGKEPLGWAIILLLIYFFLEYVRPANPLGIPLIISLVLFAGWVRLKEKIWVPQVICLYLLIMVIAVMGPFAVNNFSVWIGFQSMVAWLACISVPMIHFADSPKKIMVLADALIMLHGYLAVHALLHGGFGPGGFVGDENDVALAINTMMPLAFCLFLSAQTFGRKAFYLLAVVIMVAGVVSTKSRGGFLGLVAVIVYCFIFSPRKKLGLAIGSVLVIFGLITVPDSYWEEMSTISKDAESDVGTGAHRKKLWGVAVTMFQTNPIFGVGLNNFPWNVGDYMSVELLEHEGRSYMGTAAHSVYFTILSETGAAGVLVIASIVYFSVRSIRRLLAQARKIESLTTLRDDVRATLIQMKGMAYGLGGGMLGYGVSGIFLTAFVYPHFWYVVALIVAVATVTERMAVDAIPLRPAASGRNRRALRVRKSTNDVS